MSKIGIVGGAGDVGAMVGFNIAIEGLAHEIVLIDLLEEKARAQANDISHSVAWERDVEVYQGDYEDAEAADLFVITAGKPREPGMSRLDLIEENKEIMRKIGAKVNEFSPGAVTVLTTNPLDVMNYALYKYGNRPPKKTIGEAGMLDSARFRYVLSKKFGVGLSDVEAYILGEHGDSQVPLFSKIRVKGESKTVDSESEREKILDTLRESAMRVIEGKGATVFGPARGVSLIVDSILNDKRKVYPCSVVPDGEFGLKDGSIGLPVELGSSGVENVIEWELENEELEKLRESHRKVLEVCQQEIV